VSKESLIQVIESRRDWLDNKLRILEEAGQNNNSVYGHMLGKSIAYTTVLGDIERELK